MDDLRSAIDAAVTETEKTEVSTPTSTPAPVAAAPAPATPIEGEVVSKTVEPRTNAPAAADKPKSIEEVANVPKSDEPNTPKEENSEPRVVDPRIDRAPASWKGDAKKLWAELPLAARQEVIRRERDTTKVMQDAAQARNQIEPIKEALAPHMDRIQQMYHGNAIQAITNLMGVERTLVSGTSQDKVQLVARMIDRFGIDIQMLDAALSNQPLPAAQPNNLSQIEQLVNQRLAPVMDFLGQQQQREQAQVRQIEQQAVHTVETMAMDPQYPYFEDVRQDMADIIEMGARRGVAISMEDAYTRAVRMNDDTFQATSARESTQQATQQALQAHQAAQKAKGAAVSVSGSPMATGTNAGNPADLRGTIAAAFSDTGGRL